MSNYSELKCKGRIACSFDAKIFIVSLLVLILAACAGATKQEKTLASLKTIEIDTQTTAIPQQRQEDARKHYESVLKSTKNDVLKARAMERLADIQLEGHQKQKTIQEEKEVSDFGPASKTKKAAAAPDDTDYTVVAKQYETLLKRDPKSPENERIYYQLSRAYDLDGETKKSLNVLTRMIKQFPRTEHLIEIQFRRGEMLFMDKKFPDAAKAYKVVVDDQESNFYERALYKYAWSLFKQNELQAALESFYSLLDFYYENKVSYDRFSRSEREIVDDAFRAISLAFSFQDGAETIYAFTKKYGERTYVFQVYENLAKLYLKQERYEDTAKVYQAYVKYFPNDAASPKFMIKTIEIYKKGGFPTALTGAKESLIENYGVGNSYWKKHDRKLLEEIQPYLKASTEDLAQHYHAKGQKSKSKKDYNKAAYWYRKFVDSFPKDKTTPAMHFLLADSLIESKKYEEAAVEYEETAYRYPVNSKSAEAAYASILAYKEVLEEIKKNPKSVKKLDEAVLNSKKRIINASLRFADHFPKDKRVALVVIKSAEDLLNMKLYADASNAARRITNMQSKKAKSLYPQAWAIIATSEFEMGNHKAAELAMIQRLQLTSPDDKNRKASIDRLAASIYKQGEDALNAGNLEEAADHFLRIASLAPTSSIRVSAEFDAAAALIKMGAWARSITVLQMFVKSYPDNKLTPDAYKQLAVSYEKTENWGAAAGVYAKIYEQTTDVNIKRDILWSTAGLYEKAGKKPDAITVYKEYVKNYNQPLAQSVEAQQKIADYYLETKQISKRNYWLDSIIKADKGKGSTDRTHFLAAKASLELAEPKYEAYMKVKLTQPLKKNLKKKKELLQQTVDAYTAAADYGVAEITTASTYRIAQIYGDFGQGLFDSERPKGLSGEELEQYDILLEEQAYPFEEKAIEIHETNAGRVAGGVYDEWVKKSFSVLRKLNPVRYAKNERSELFNKVLN